MTRTLALSVFSILLTAQAFAAATQRYVVAVQRHAPPGRVAALMRDGGDLRPLATFNAFAADLTEAEAAALQRGADVRYVEPVVERYALGLGNAATDETRNYFGQTVPFGIDAISARNVWAVTRGRAINVVVIDTGVDYRHPDLSASYAGGYNTLNRTSDGLDDHGHGTHVAGTIAATDNNLGVVGVAPEVRLWSVKVLDSTGKGTNEHVIAALDWVIKKKRALGGNWVLNLSLGAKTASTAEREAFARAIDEGLLIVAASGNDSSADAPAPVSYPAAYSGVIAVGAVDERRNLASFSNQGPELSVVAPGVGILSTVQVGSGSLAAVRTSDRGFVGRALDGSKKGSVTGEWVFCGLGKTGEFPSSVNGRIAVIRRGELPFSEKTRNAKAAGAAAVVMLNNDGSALNFTLLNSDDPTSSSFDWPVTIALSKTDGDVLLAAPGVTITVLNENDDYGYKNGTSMATPHVAGAAALAWSVAPSARAADVRLALTSTATDLGPAGVDPAYGSGGVDAFRAARQLNPAAVPEPIPSGRRVLRRGGR